MAELPNIVKQRLQMAQGDGEHPDADLLTAFAENTLRGTERERILGHVSHCLDCRDLLTLALPQAEQMQPVASITRSHPSLSVLRWGALAVASLVIVAGVSLRRHSARQMALLRDDAPAQVTAQLKQPEEFSRPETSKPKVAESDVASSTNSAVLAKKMAAGSTVARSEPLGSDPLSAKINSRSREASAYSREATQKNEVTSATHELDAPTVAASPTRTESAASAASSSPGLQIAENTAPAAALARNELGISRAKPDLTTPELDKKADTSGASADQGAASLKAESTLNQMAAASPPASPLDAVVAQSRVAARSSLNSQPEPRWTLTPDGTLQRSFDSGRRWKTVIVAKSVRLRAIAASGSQVWVGGAAGALYHSSDAGQHWKRVAPVGAGVALTADITGVEFSDPSHLKLHTADNLVWSSEDGGGSWNSGR